MSRVPARGMLGVVVQETAEVNRFLAPEEASYVTGHSLVADGGCC